ncbi:putative peptidyl-trna hydrolase domain protein [Botrytis fragariae]|uniref:Putative peptidyl-trna hydrolase domain protein n=1 Tax=Botrytis fragariae TaxID=1964551 RepID=A0A8H6ELU4_9HELO|nr:putative peptidyl-trna hydrolase domain protein [Botrytis fragariae]KAF5876675.1 putative peptidyl-trna hydrolase domain protein [Botrytis fragariae]
MHYFAKLTAKLLQLSSQGVKPIYTSPFQTRPSFTGLNLQCCRSYSVQSTDDIEFEVARKWYSNFNESTISTKLAETTYSAAGGPGGQKTNKTSSKANTIWSMKKLDAILPLIISKGLRRGTYYVKNTDAIQIQCDSSRNRTDNKEETHRRLNEEIKRIYRTTVPGKASIEQQQRVKHLQTSANIARLKMKKQHGDKKKSRSSGKGGGDI